MRQKLLSKASQLARAWHNWGRYPFMNTSRRAITANEFCGQIKEGESYRSSLHRGVIFRLRTMVSEKPKFLTRKNKAFVSEFP